MSALRMSHGILVASLLSALEGCPVASTGVGARHATEPSRSDLDGITLHSMSVETDAPPVDEYGAAVEHVLSVAEQSVVEAMASLPVTHLPALSRTTRALALNAPDQHTMPPSLVAGLMAWSGLADPPPRIIVVELAEDSHRCHEQIGPGCEGAVASLVEQVELTPPEVQPVNIGVGVVSLPDGATRMMVAVIERAVELEPFSMAIAEDGAVEVTGRLLGERSKPEIHVVSPDGRGEELDAGPSIDGRFSAQIECTEGPGRYQVEVFAEGAYGPEVAANFPIYCGVEPPRSISMEVEELEASVDAGQIARANFLYLNEERERRGLPALAWAPDAAAIATDHCRDMAAHDFVGHRSPTTGKAKDRFVAAGVEVTVVRENVARGYGPKGIHETLMSSPGHRVNILATDVTHVGVGVVLGEAETDVPGAARPVYATQNFYEKPGSSPPVRDPGPTLQARIDERRKREGLPPVPWDPELSAIAQRFAKAVDRGRSRPRGYEDDVLESGHIGVSNYQLSSPNFDTLVEAGLFGGVLGPSGLGVVRTKGDDGVDEFLVVVLVAESQ